MIFIDIETYNILILKDFSMNYYMPPDDVDELYNLLGIMLDGLRIQNILGKNVYIMSSKTFSTISKPGINYSWIDPSSDLYSFEDRDLIVDIHKQIKKIYK